MSKTSQLKDILKTSNLDYLMEAHNGISAKIVEETGFKGIWASGLSISAQCGVRDSNELSYTQVLDICEYMSDITTIPILLDGDTGFGNFNNARRLVNKLEKINIAGVCIEDKLFPKTNSFIGSKQKLEDPEVFSRKIQAMKDTQVDPNFQVVARVEAFISGYDAEEAVRRAEIYKEAGADSILMHSKKSTCEDIDNFIKLWENKHPVVIVPTTYHGTPTQHFKDIGINTIIWANHNIRSSITAMQNITKKIYDASNISCVNDNIVPVKEIFRLTNDAELRLAEKKYL